METICIVIPYFGAWPEWTPLFLDSCAYNRTINWTFITDRRPLITAAPNVRFVHMSWEACAALLARHCGVRDVPFHSYKLCDYRFAYGDVFADLLRGFTFWGFGDIDVIYGDLRSFLGPSVMAHDLITFNRTHVSGHFTLLRNDESVIRRYRHYRPWLDAIGKRQNMRLDEDIGYYGIDNVYAIESYNTPLSPYIPWTGGEFIFPAEWYYVRGRLFNNIDGERHFMYLHFMRYKYAWEAAVVDRVIHFDVGDEIGSWTLALDGFHRHSRAAVRCAHGRGIAVLPAGVAEYPHVPSNGHSVALIG